MHRRILVVSIALLGALLVANISAYATHCQIHGSVNRGLQSGPGLAGWKIVKTPVEGFGMDTVTTDALGNFQFTLLPGNVTYRIHPIVPVGWFPLDAIPGANTLNGDLGEVSTSTKIDEMTLDVFVKNGTVNSNNRFIVGTQADTVQYRTAAYRDWADAKDQKNKRKAIKCKPDKVEFDFEIPVDSLAVLYLFGSSGWRYIEFTDVSRGDTIFRRDVLDGKAKEFAPAWGPQISKGDILRLHGFASGDKKLRVKYAWANEKAKKEVTSFTTNQPRLAMPNLHNVGEDIYRFMVGTPAWILIGGIHSVEFDNYKHVLKTLVKETKGGAVYHTEHPRCLDYFDKNGKPIKTRQKGLPPDKHDNILLAEQLTLKLNAEASELGIFPPGFRHLIYDNHIADPSPFDSERVMDVITQVDQYLSCESDPLHTGTAVDSMQILRVVQNINAAFAGPMDTTSWSCGKVICTGVKALKDVPYLRANPSAVPRIDFSSGPRLSYTEQPSVFALSQNYPNPFNPTTTIEFTLARDAIVTLRIYNTLGQEVAELIHSELMDEGMQEVEFSATGGSASGGDASSLPSGVYYYRIVAQDIDGSSILYSDIRKMLLVK